MDKNDGDLCQLPIGEALARLHTDAARGLSSDDVAQRRAQYGPNAIAEQRVSPLLKLLSYFWGPVPWMIEVAALLSVVVQHWADFAIIVIMLLLNVAVGFWQEHKADTAIATLKRSLALKARALRDGRWQDLPGAGAGPWRHRAGQARQHHTGGRQADRRRLPERRRIGAYRRVTAGRQESR